GVYEQQEPWFAAILGIRGDAELDATVAGLHQGGRRRAEAILVPAARTLRMPLEAAAAMVSAQALFQVWQHLTGDIGYSTPAAAALVADFLDGALFGA